MIFIGIEKFGFDYYFGEKIFMIQLGWIVIGLLIICPSIMWNEFLKLPISNNKR